LTTTTPPLSDRRAPATRARMTSIFRHSPTPTPPTLEERVSFLEGRLFEALVEIEALRRVQLERDAAAYARAYCATSADSHNSAGPSGGVQKIIWAWDGQWPHTVETRVASIGPRHRFMRPHEWAMLARLGMSADEIAAHVDRIEEVSHYT
jgi:hypothetical protein